MRQNVTLAWDGKMKNKGRQHTNARLSEKDWIVFRSAGKNLDSSSDLIVTAYDWV